MSAISYHRDKKLEQRIARLLSALRLLSEAESTSVVHFQRHGAKASSKAPKGAFRGRSPDPDESLLIWFLHRLERTKGGPALNALCAEGEVRLAKRKQRQPGREAGTAYEGVRETATDRDKRIAEEYVGLDPAEVRVIESERSGFVSEANIRLVRLRAKRDPEDGRPQEIPEELEERQRLCRELYEAPEAPTMAQLALRFRVSKMTISRWLGKANGEDKAA